MKILLLGAQGQVGHELLRVLRALGDVVPVARQMIPGWPGTVVCDLSQAPQWETLWRQALEHDGPPAVIVNAAAWTAVDAAESQPAAADLLNHRLPATLAHYAEQHAVRLVHLSTDYVFPGAADQAYVESDATGPESVYGRTKLAGEHAVLHSAADAVVVRTSWVYSGRRQNFLRAMLSRMLRGEALRVVADQYGCPSWARDVADGLGQMVRQWPAGDTAACDGATQGGTAQAQSTHGGARRERIYHLAGAASGSWFDFAQHIARGAQQLGLWSAAPADFPTPAPRPAWSVLNSDRFARQFGFRAGGWKSVYACLEELKEARCWFP